MEIVSMDKAMLFAAIFLGCSLLVVFAIILDLWDGVYTAKALHDKVHSHKLRVTINKMGEYWRFLIIGFLIDCIGVIFDFYILPFVTVVFGTGLILIEVKSMFEHARRRQSNTSELQHIIQHIVDCKNHNDAQSLLENIVGIVKNDEQTTNKKR